MPAKRRRRLADALMINFYNQRARGWGERYMLRHHWRIGAMYDIEDIRQDTFAVWLRVFRRHPELEEPDLFRIFKRGIQGRVDNRSRQCFPNSYAYVENHGKLVINLDDIQSVADPNIDVESFLSFWSDVVVALPVELIEVVRVLVRDFLNIECIEQRRKATLSGRSRMEPFEVSLARRIGVTTSRELLTELEKALNRTTEYGMTSSTSKRGDN